MTFTLHLEVERWRAHQDRALAETPTLVPVVKGNGYGFGLERLAGECGRLGVRTAAVGVPEEVAALRSAFSGDVVVLTPWHPALEPPPDVDVIRTVSHLDALRALVAQPARVVVELATSMRRHGLSPDQLGAAAEIVGAPDGASPGALFDLGVPGEVAHPVQRPRFEGLSLHLPMVGDRLAEARSLLAGADAAGLPTDRVWVSHLDPGQVRALAAERPGREVLLRSGTGLWLGDPGAFAARGRVLDVHRLAAGDRFGYRLRRARRGGWLVVVGGGTAHGVALEAPSSVPSLRARATVLALAGMEAAGVALSPFEIAGRRRPFAEPPHMQVSMVLLPAAEAPPALGDELPVTVRMTTVRFDQIFEQA